MRMEVFRWEFNKKINLTFGGIAAKKIVGLRKRLQ